uniref:Nanos-type domain-containing protein n=1 Tax=Romanomermis culicivorax TaxID=13658 RepID=A0A915IYS0_ROMCU
MSYNLSFPTLSAAPAVRSRPILGRNFSNNRQQNNHPSSSFSDLNFNSTIYSNDSDISESQFQNRRRRIASTPGSYFNNNVADLEDCRSIDNGELFIDDFQPLSINKDSLAEEISTPKAFISPNPWSPANHNMQKPVKCNFSFPNVQEVELFPVNIPLNQNFQELPIMPNFYTNKINQEKRPYHIKKQDECVFCKNNNLSPAEYKGHLVKDPRTKKVTCPVLRNMPCKRCHASGDFAHTDRYCPAKPPIARIFTVQK